MEMVPVVTGAGDHEGSWFTTLDSCEGCLEERREIKVQGGPLRIGSAVYMWGVAVGGHMMLVVLDCHGDLWGGKKRKESNWRKILL